MSAYRLCDSATGRLGGGAARIVRIRIDRAIITIMISHTRAGKNFIDGRASATFASGGPGAPCPTYATPKSSAGEYSTGDDHSIGSEAEAPSSLACICAMYMRHVYVRYGWFRMSNTLATVQ